MTDQRSNWVVYVKVLSEPMEFPLSVSPGKEMGDHTRQRKNSPNSAEIEHTTSRFEHLLLYRLSCEARREQVTGDYRCNCGNVNVKGTMDVLPLALITQMTDHRINSALYVKVLT